MRRILLLLLACGLLLSTLPAAAEVYTIRLTNGASFESRYAPKEAAWDASMVTFLDETGLEVALPQSLVAEVTAQSEIKGYGKVINTTTIDLGFSPNDIDAVRQMMGLPPGGGFEGLENVATSFDQQQFVEPGEMGGGIPVGFAGGGGVPTVFPPSPPLGSPVAPGATFPTPPTTPPPFTTLTPSIQAPFTNVPATPPASPPGQ